MIKTMTKIVVKMMTDQPVLMEQLVIGDDVCDICAKHGSVNTTGKTLYIRNNFHTTIHQWEVSGGAQYVLAVIYDCNR